jgi:hypothetical protein
MGGVGGGVRDRWRQTGEVRAVGGIGITAAVRTAAE